MAEHILETVIQLRCDTYSNWMNSALILKVGEAAIATFPSERVIDGLSTTTPEHTPPAVGIKIGDGYHRFTELPWLQAVAADVYNWAKMSTKPTYTANEISGLSTYLEENFNLSGDITIAPRIYQIIQGTDENENKYYLRYKENNEEAQWIVDTLHPIDLTPYATIVEWIGTLPERYATLGTFTSTQTGRIIEGLSYTDTEQTNQFVTAVSETAGIINVERAQPSFSNISGIAGVQQGGSGLNAIPEGHVLVGTGGQTATTRPIAESIANNNHLVPNNLIKAYVDSAVAGLTGAMHFRGESTVVIRQNSTANPNINGYNFANALPGDVVLYMQQEYVWDGGRWILLGDEGSYAVKGSIKDADVAADAEIAQSKIANLSETFNTKVDKVDGKSLTSNDFTDELKDKLDGIQEGAQRNTIEHIFLNNDEIPTSTKNGITNSIDLQIKEFDDNSQKKLHDIEAEAQVNKIEKIVFDGTAIIPDASKTVTFASKPEYANTIEHIKVNNIEQRIDNNKTVNIVIDQAALNLNVLEGAIIPTRTGETEEVPQSNKKLELARIAKTGNIKDILQENDEYVILYCGTSTDVI